MRTLDRTHQIEAPRLREGTTTAGGSGPRAAGTDAAPYFRVFNPVLQSRKFDPEGRYIRRFVPELLRVPAEKIHEPRTMTPEEQKESGCRIGKDYPARIVDRAREKEVALGDVRCEPQKEAAPTYLCRGREGRYRVLIHETAPMDGLFRPASA